jgi:hypothetical protein
VLLYARRPRPQTSHRRPDDAEIERERSGGVQYWALFDHRNGEFVGCGGLRPWLYTPGEANFEVGFHLVKRCWARGSQRKQRPARSNTLGKNCDSRKSTLGITPTIDSALGTVAADWEQSQPTPPPVIWRRKLQEIRDLALAALTFSEVQLPGQRSWAEIPFGGDRRARDLTPEDRATLPWDPMAPVVTIMEQDHG